MSTDQWLLATLLPRTCPASRIALLIPPSSSGQRYRTRRQGTPGMTCEYCSWVGRFNWRIVDVKIYIVHSHTSIISPIFELQSAMLHIYSCWWRSRVCLWRSNEGRDRPVLSVLARNAPSQQVRAGIWGDFPFMGIRLPTAGRGSRRNREEWAPGSEVGLHPQKHRVLSGESVATPAYKTRDFYINYVNTRPAVYRLKWNQTIGGNQDALQIPSL